MYICFLETPTSTHQTEEPRHLLPQISFSLPSSTASLESRRLIGEGCCINGNQEKKECIKQTLETQTQGKDENSLSSNNISFLLIVDISTPHTTGRKKSHSLQVDRIWSPFPQLARFNSYTHLLKGNMLLSL